MWFHKWESFMVQRLKLKGVEVMVYAVIYGFTQTKGEFSGSLKYLSEVTGYTPVQCCRVLNSLVEKGYIKKNIVSIKNIRYKAVPIEELKLDDKIPANASNFPTECETQSGVSNPITDKNKSIYDEMDAINNKPPNQPTEYGNKMLAKIKASIQK